MADLLIKQLGTKINLLRHAKGGSRQHVADALEMSSSAYGCIERGETDIALSRLEQLAQVFEIGLADLVGGTNSHNCNNWHSGAFSPHIHYELEKNQLLLHEREKENALLRQQITQLEEINGLLKQK